MGNVIMKAQQVTYGASNVEKALDDLNVPELIELNKRMDAVDAWKANVHEETYTGSELTIENALALPARSLITSINAIQDLHGQSAPYVGGAGKNKLAFPYQDTTKTVSGITCTVNSDGTVTVTGTATDRVDFTLFQGVVPSEWSGMKFSGNPLAGDTGIMLIQQRGGDWTNYCNSVYSDHEETINNIPVGTTVWAFIRIFGGKTVNATIKPMISTEGGTFAPYSNICPISGRTAVAVDDTGLNQFDKDHVSSFAGFIDTATNTYKSNSAYKLCYIPCEGNTTYTISKVAGKTFRVASSVGIPAADVPFINTAANHTGTTLTFTTAADAHYLAVLYWSSANGDTLTPEQIEATLQIEIGSTATSYEPYAHSSATIQLGTTVYGADINWDTGVMTVLDVIADMGDLTWAYNSTSQVFNSSLLPGATTENVYTDAICSIYKEHQTGMSAMVNGDFRVLDGVMTVKDTAYTDATAFKTAVTGQTVCYKLATPTTIQLTPTQLEMLKGYNRVSVGGGYATIELKALVLGGDN